MEIGNTAQPSTEQRAGSGVTQLAFPEVDEECKPSSAYLTIRTGNSCQASPRSPCLCGDTPRTQPQSKPRCGANRSAKRKKAVHTNTIAAPEATLT